MEINSQSVNLEVTTVEHEMFACMKCLRISRILRIREHFMHANILLYLKIREIFMHAYCLTVKFANFSCREHFMFYSTLLIVLQGVASKNTYWVPFCFLFGYLPCIIGAELLCNPHMAEASYILSNMRLLPYTLTWWFLWNFECWKTAAFYKPIPWHTIESVPSHAV